MKTDSAFRACTRRGITHWENLLFHHGFVMNNPNLYDGISNKVLDQDHRGGKLPAR